MPYYRCPACGLTSYSAAAYSTASVCPYCSAGLTEESKLHLVPGAGHDLRRVLPARPQAVAQARRSLIGFALPETTRRALAVLVSELVTNSIRHAGLRGDDVIDLRVSNGDRRVHVSVHDQGRGFSPPAPSNDPLAVGGLGFVLVDGLCEAWGVACDEDGCTVWCDLAIDRSQVAATAPDAQVSYVAV